MKLRTVKEVAEELDVAPITVVRLVNSGDLLAVELARRTHRRILRFRPETIAAFISSREFRQGPTIAQEKGVAA